MNSNTKSIVLASVAVLSWSTVATAFKIALSQLTYFEMLLVSCITAFMIFTVWMTVERKWGQLRKVSPKLWGTFALLGLLNPVCYYLVLFKSYSFLPAQVAQPINYMWPIVLLVLLAIFDKQPIPGRKYIGMVMSLGGVAFISLGGKGITGDLSPVGLGLAAFSALLWATYWMFNNRLKDSVDECVSLFLSFLFGTVYMCIAACFMPVDISSWSGILAGMYIGGFEIGIPFICFGMAIRITSNPALINQMCYLSPFMSLFFIAVILGEPIMLTTYIGLFLIVAGIVYNQYFAVPSGKPKRQLS